MASPPLFHPRSAPPPPSHDRRFEDRPLSLGAAVLTLVITLFACQLLGAIAMIPAIIALVLLGRLDGDALLRSDAAARISKEPLVLFASVTAIGATLVAVTYLSTKIAKRRFGSALVLTAPRWFDVVLAVFLIFGASPFADAAAISFARQFPDLTFGVVDTISGAMRGHAVAAIIIGAAISLCPGFAEELFFRGLLQPSLVAKAGAPIGIALASILFGAFHLDPPQAISAAILGGALGFVAYRTKTLVPAMVAHAANNAVAVVYARLGPVDSLATASIAWEGLVGGGLLTVVVTVLIVRTTKGR